MHKLKSHNKFNLDKSYKYFPGLTIIKLFNDEDLIKLIISLKRDMEQSGYFNKFVFLPEDSYHMTVCDLITFNDLKTNKNFKRFPLKNETNIDLIDQYVYKLLKSDEFVLNVKMKLVKITSRKIHLQPKTKEDNLKLKLFRKKICEKLKIKLSDSYIFHISLTYRLFDLTVDEKEKLNSFLDTLNSKYINKFSDIDIDIANLAIFNDMSEYRKLLMGRKKLGNY